MAPGKKNRKAAPAAATSQQTGGGDDLVGVASDNTESTALVSGVVSLCPRCEENVAGGGVRCARCEHWYHPSCADVPETVDCQTLQKFYTIGWRWYCSGDCLQKNPEPRSIEGLKASIIGEVSSAIISAVALQIKEINNKIVNLEAKIPTQEGPSFANIVQQTLESSKKLTEKHTTEVMDGGKKKTIQDHQVLVVKPNSDAAQELSPSETKKIETALASVPVTKCKKTISGALVVKFPSKGAKDNASKAIQENLGTNTTLTVTEPKKMLPKMTLVGVSSDIHDDDIVPSIIKKNAKIESLVSDGLTLKLLFTIKKGDASTKDAVIKMSPEVRSAVVDGGNFVYVGLARCRAYDRFWVTQCYHCQGFGHKNNDCPKRSDEPKCGFCAGSHESRSCTNKGSPKCVNCVQSSTAVEPGAHSHFASSRLCPIMTLQRNKVIENTNFISSKN